MSHDPFKSSKREWKRYDPEPKEPEKCPRCEWLPWEKNVWVAVAIIAVLLGSQIMAGVTH